jgi:primosomal protein N' (replication factor Y)
MADAGHRAVQAMVRWDPSGAAHRELADRTELGFPPITCLAEVTGGQAAVAEILAAAALPDGADVLGPQPEDPPPGARPVRRGGRASGSSNEGRVRAVVRVPREEGEALARAFAVARAGRSARKAPDTVRVRIDPVDLG